MIFSWFLSDLNMFQMMIAAMKTQSNLYETSITAFTSNKVQLIRKLSSSAKITVSIPIASMISRGTTQCLRTVA